MGTLRIGGVLVVVAVAAAAQAWPGKRTTWHGFERRDFTHAGRACIVVSPKKAHPSRPWIWRARFFGHEPQADRALLKKGFHLAYCDVANWYGNSRAVAAWDAFHRFLTRELSLSETPVVEAMSRGGLIAYAWGIANPRKVAAIYADNPVLDVASWPLGRGAGKRSPSDRTRLLAAYGVTEEELVARPALFERLAPLARAGVPLLHVCGLADDVVPFAENTGKLLQRYRALGGPITLISKLGAGHHPHALEDPDPIVRFAWRHAVARPRYRELRTGLRHVAEKLRSKQAVRVAFLGGSITHNRGWRDHLMHHLRERFPAVAFSFVNAGIPSMGSTPGAFRLRRDVLAEGPVDLLFVEAAVNDSTNGRTPSEQLRGMEGIVRHVRRDDPRTDIVMMHFVDPEKMRAYRGGSIPDVISVHERVAAHYGVASLNLAREMTDRIDAREFTWREDFKNLHPSPFGQMLYFRAIQQLLDAAWKAPLESAPHRLPPPLDAACYDRGELVTLARAKPGEGFRRVERWRPDDGAGTRRGFVDLPMLEARTPDAELAFSFRGTAVGILVVAGPDAGRLAYRIDDGPDLRVELFTRWSRGLHLPWAHVLAAGLAPGEHRLTLRVLSERHPRSAGTAVRISSFLVNGAPR